ncbi:ArsR/SmtB family transcription factor [Kribbella sp. NPDC051586]|uniref:ArsR/SmtB family transcription factor n=1 Tax=Kribbella sp. NPDC051586 TaxID=3364118 RepID=UPI0037A83476
MAQPQVVLVQSPQQSVFLALREALGHRGPYSSRHVLQPLRRIVARAEYEPLLRPLRPGQNGGVPDVVVPLIPPSDVSVPDQVAAMREYSPQLFLDEIETLGGDSAVWRTAARDPENWLRAYAELSDLCWRALEPRWRLLRPAFDAEAERVGMAAVRDRLPDALNTISSRLTFTDDSFCIDGSQLIPYAGRRLALVPSIGAPDQLFVNGMEPDVISIAYPLRGFPDVSPVRSVEDPLDVVLGGPRARVLRMLGCALTVGAIAAELGVTPAAASRHCDVLTRAGLITRDRHGRQVLVSRTSRGNNLLDVL